MSRAILFAGALALAGCGDNLLAPAPPRYLAITIDTEALPGRSDGADVAVDRLIYGDFGDGQRAGIDDLMDAADRHGVTLTFFVDVVEDSLYPGQLEAVAEHITARGHDVELHTHPEIGGPNLWATLGFAQKASNDFTRSEAAALLSYATGVMSEWAVPTPMAYRAGAYRYSAGFVDALPDLGFTQSYNYNVAGKSQVDLHLAEQATFAWSNGLVEVPISYVHVDGARHRFDDGIYRSGGAAGTIAAMDEFASAWGTDQVLVLMMHSWSLLDPGPSLDGDPTHFHFVYGGDERRRAFDAFLSGLPPDVTVVTPRDVQALLDSGALVPSPTIDPSAIFGSGTTAQLVPGGEDER